MKKALRGNHGVAGRRAAVLLAAGLLACPVVTRANTTYTWSGGNANTGYFDVGSNWAGNTAPPLSGPSDLIFGSINLHGNSPYTEFNYNVSSVTFNASALAFAIGTSNNNTITVGAGGVTDNAASAENLYLGLVLNANQTWNVSNAVGSLTLNVGLTNTSSSTLTKIGAGTLNLSGTGSAIGGLSANAGLTQLTAGSLTLSSGFGVSAATLNVSGGAVLNSAISGVQAIDSGSSMTVTGAGSQWLGGNQVEVGGGAVGSLTVASGGIVSTGTFLAVGTNGGSNGTLTVSSGGVVSGPVTVLGYFTGSTGSATVSGSGSVLNASAFLALGGNGSVGGTGTLTISSSGVVNTPFVEFESPTSSVNVSGGTLNAGYLTSLNSGYGSIALTGGNVLNINGSSGTNTYSGSISGTGSIVKNGAASQILSGSNAFTGLVTVNAGTLEMGSGAASGYSSTGGTLQLDFGTFGSATLFSYVGGTIIYNTQTISGGTLIGNGTHNVSAVNNFEGTTIDNGVAITPNAQATFYGVSSAGYITNPAGTNFNWDGGTNAGGNFNISGTTGVASWTSSGVTQINNGGTLYAFNSNLVLLGGSRTYVGTPAVHGGTINLFTSGITLELDGGLLVNNGNISGGTVDVNYAGLATGTGSYSNVVVNPGGTYMPGNYGNGSPLAVLGSPAAMIQPATSGSTSTSNTVTTTTETIITVNTGDTLTLAGGLNASGQSVTLQGGGRLIVAPFSATTLNVSAGTLKLSPSPSVLSISSLLVGSSATLDITTDAADISSGSLASLNLLVQQGYNSGRWNGSGITSTAAAADTKHLTAIGVIQNNQGGSAIYNSSHQFLNTTPGASDILLAYTYYGDTNLDGKVDGSDYSRIDAAYLADKTNPTAMTGWFNGDFNYDGVVNGSDYTLIDNAFNTQGALLLAQIATPTAQLAGSPETSVPEPAGLGVVVICAISSLGRRICRRASSRSTTQPH